ncbi:MAG: hypothetical protein PHE24_06850 [Patescibacteria group bacterium]|nr:hypothetical protein [Patescibacteria group bacterium]
MEQNTNSVDVSKMPTPENTKKKEKMYFIVGFLVPIIAGLLVLLKSPIVGLWEGLSELSFFVAVTFLFIRKYRQIGKKYLFGFLCSAILGFIATIVIVAMKK